MPIETCFPLNETTGAVFLLSFAPSSKTQMQMTTNKKKAAQEANFKGKMVLAAALFILTTNSLLAQTIDSTLLKTNYRHSVQFSALEVMGRIYSFAYFYEFSPKNNLMLGLAYENIQYDCGTTHAPALLIGYRRFFWKGLNADYAFWPAYNSFYENTEKKYYKSLELWGELRVGYEFNFKINKLPIFITPQYIIGKGLLRGYKPQSFIDYYKNEEPVFLQWNISLGVKF